MKRKSIVILSLVLLIATLIAPAAAQDGDDEIKLEFWNWWGVQREPLMLEIIEPFEEENPGVTVENVVQAWDNRAETVMTAIAGGDPPEVMMVSRQELVRLASEGLIAPITEYVEKYDVDLDAFYDSEIETMWWDGELYSMPMPTAGGETSLIIYNNALFEDSGFDPENPPETWQELWEFSEAVTEFNEDGSIAKIGAHVGTSFLPWLYTNNGALYSEDLRSVTFNSAEGVETLQWMIDYTNEIYGGIENLNDFFALTTGEGADHPFYQERQAIMFPNVSIFGHVATFAPDMEYGVSLRPHNGENDEAESKGIAPLTFGWGYVIPASLDEAAKEAAYKFVQRITYDMGEDVKGGCWFMQEQSRPSPLKECNEDEIYYELNPAWDNVKKGLAADVALPVVPVQSEILSVLNEYVEYAFYGDFTVEEALNIAAEEAQYILDDYWASVEE